MTTTSIKPTHKAIQAYYDTLAAYGGQEVTHETAVRSAFQSLLAETAKIKRWTLVPELSMKVKGQLVRPDGTVFRTNEVHLCSECDWPSDQIASSGETRSAFRG